MISFSLYDNTLIYSFHNVPFLSVYMKIIIFLLLIHKSCKGPIKWFCISLFIPILYISIINYLYLKFFTYSATQNLYRIDLSNEKVLALISNAH